MIYKSREFFTALGVLCENVPFVIRWVEKTSIVRSVFENGRAKKVNDVNGSFTITNAKLCFIRNSSADTMMRACVRSYDSEFLLIIICLVDIKRVLYSDFFRWNANIWSRSELFRIDTSTHTNFDLHENGIYCHQCENLFGCSLLSIFNPSLLFLSLSSSRIWFLIKVRAFVK